jgi:uncharacterized protein YbbC (DUF1343 family)
MEPIRRRQVLAGLAGLAAVPALPGAATATTGAGPGSRHGGGRRFQTGIEVLIADRYRPLRGQRVGIVSNPTGVLPDLRHEVDVMAASDQVDLVAVFGPEHGFRGTAQAGGSEGTFVDPKTGLTVYDAYAKGVSTLATYLTQSGVDTVVFDIQDVGVRFYTYIWALYDFMRAAAMTGKRFVVLDRPNPINGLAADGPVLHPEFATGVGREPIAQQHGMTMGELARFYNAEFLPSRVGNRVDLTVIPLRGWTRGMRYEDTGLPWVPPSPNMPTVDTAHVYPGTCLFEGTNLSEGRGTTRPFELIGAPYIDHRWQEALAAMRLPGVLFREAYFLPVAGANKYPNVVCGGVQVVVTDRDDFNPIRTAIAMLVALKRVFPAEFAWRPDNWIDRLTGTTWVRTAIDAGAGVDEVVAGWQSDLAAFRRLRARHLLYSRR